MNDYITTPTESQIYQNVGNWLALVLPGVPAGNIMQGQVNRIAPPKDPFVTMLITGRERLATNDWSYDYQSTRTIVENAKITMQVDVFGAATSNQMQAITTLWRDMFAVDFFTAAAIPISPLYTSATRQLGFITGEKQFDDQWTVDLTMQVNFTLAVPQQFATEITITPISVDVEYPPA